MTRKTADAKTQMAQAQTDTIVSPDDTGAAPAVAPATAPSPSQATPPSDEHHGRGGLYQRNANGTRTLIERTQPAA